MMEKEITELLEDLVDTLENVTKILEEIVEEEERRAEQSLQFELHFSD